MDLIKYPRTPHLEGSRRQFGDPPEGAVAWADFSAGIPTESADDDDVPRIVIEEKLDGANAAFSFAPDGALLLQSRGHFLTGGGRERHFALFKTWAHAHAACFFDRLGDRYIVFGEWLYAKHTIFYDSLPHYFLEFDVYDRAKAVFLSTRARRRLLGGVPIRPVPVLADGAPPTQPETLVRAALFKSPDWGAALTAQARAEGLDPARAVAETDASPLAEGLYLKRETGDRLIARAKWVRGDFLQAVAASDSHWLSRPIVPNRLSPGVDIFVQKLGGGAYDG